MKAFAFRYNTLEEQHKGNSIECLKTITLRQASILLKEPCYIAQMDWQDQHNVIITAAAKEPDHE